MPRNPGIRVPGAFYHVTLRGNHRQNIFFCPADRTRLEELTAEMLERYVARLHAYCWMTNHVHMLIQVGDEPLGRLILQIALANPLGKAAKQRPGAVIFRQLSLTNPLGKAAKQRPGAVVFRQLSLANPLGKAAKQRPGAVVFSDLPPHP